MVGRTEPAVAELLGDLPPGDAVDLAAGEGGALWLAGLGWRVTAVDFSGAGLARGMARPGADTVTWVRADVLGWAAPPEAWTSSSSPTCVPEDDTRALLARAVGWLRPGGRLLVLGHDVENIASGVGGPQEPAVLHSVDRLRPVADLLEVDRLEQVPRETPRERTGHAAVGRRPARPVAPER